MTTSASVEPLNILLVEDNDDDVVFLQECFGSSDRARIEGVVDDGTEALDYLRRVGRYAGAAPPHLVLLDINLPRMNGFEFLARVKRDPAFRRIPVIMLTTSHREEDVIRSFEQGACSYVTKPIHLDDLHRLVDELSHYWTTVTRLPPPAPRTRPAGS